MVLDSIVEYASNITLQLEIWMSEIESLRCPEEDLPALQALIPRFIQASAAIELKVGSINTVVKADAWKRSESLRTKVEKAVSNILENDGSKLPPIFQRNLLLVFYGPELSALDSKEMRERKLATKRRCERLRGLSPNGLISWALAFTPSSWSAGIMPNDIFNCLIDDTEQSNITWPTAIKSKLEELRKHRVLQESSEYAQFVENVINSSNNTDDEHEEVGAPSLAPGIQNREMKYMFTNAPATSIAKIPQPFRRYVRNSEQWKWERSQNYQTTACVAAVFPRDVAQDVSITIWCGANDGYRLNEFLELTEALSS